MVSKDQSIGGVILLVCAVVAVFYVVTLFYPSWLGIFMGEPNDNQIREIRFWLIAVPVFIAFIAIMGIGAWIGWTMATTPPPKPIEEITAEIEEKKEEPAPEKTEETKPAEEPQEEKKPERRKK
jgi:formate hydrogenlyase subunit 3/multisubunit Na+/H+ antiporter MnhD subunit